MNLLCSSVALLRRTGRSGPVLFLLTVVLFFFVMMAPGIASADTHVSGIISSDTTWSQVNSPYIIDGGVQVAYGVTLTIGPGAEVQGGAITSWGTLDVAGLSGQPVYLKGVSIIPAANPSTEPWQIRLSHALVDCRTGGSIYAPTGHGAYGSVSIRDSVIVGAPYMYLWCPKADCYFERNVFRQCGGISTGTDSGPTRGGGNVYIRNNVFYDEGGPIENWASYGTSKTVVEYNTFEPGSGQICLRLTPGYVSGFAAIDGRNNYWGTTDAAQIPARIYDKTDDLNCAGYIPFTPFLTEPDALTPALDLAAPTISVPGITEGHWYSISTLPAAVVPDSDLLKLWYTLDGSAWTPGDAVAEGMHTLMAAALDQSLNESAQAVQVGIDRTAPTTTCDAAATYKGSAVISLSASDKSGGSGVATTEWRLDSGTFNKGTSVNITQAGTYTLEFFSTDGAGNAESPKQVSFTVIPVPSITGFAPASGPSGTIVTITGAALADASSVAFHGTPAASFTIDSPTQISAVVPSGASSGAISVTTPGGTATSSASFQFVPAPAVTVFSPASGPVGAAVVLTGVNLTGATAVKFNGVAAVFTVSSATQITTTVPAGATSGAISVTTPGGTAATSGSFTVIPAPLVAGFTPASGKVGSSVAISGANLSWATAVRFNGKAASFSVDSAGQIQAVVPVGATTGKVTVITPGGTAVSAEDFTVVYPKPSLLRLTPTRAKRGVVVTITGAGFGSKRGTGFVKFGLTKVGKYVSWSNTRIKCRVPAKAKFGRLKVTLRTLGGTSNARTFTVKR